MLALLFLAGNLFLIPSFDSKVYADEADEATDDSFGGFGSEDITLSSEDKNAGIELYTASSSLTVGSPVLSGSTEPSGTAYVKSNVTYSVTDTTSWALQVSYASGSNALKYDGNGGTTISGAGNNVALTDNKWGYNWTDSSTAAQPSTYRTMPNYGSPNTLKSGTTNASTTGAIHFAAKFGSNATPGHYKTGVLLSLVSTAESITYYQIIYNANGGVGDVPSIVLQSSEKSAALTISGLAPTKEGHFFAGWADSNSATTAQYQAGDSIILQSTTPSKTLYAVWKPASWSTITEMQDMTPTICADGEGQGSKTLTDTRDQSTYTIQRLSDGKCWMTQNLRIVNKAITSADSNVSANYAIPASALWSDTAATTNKAYYNNDTAYGAYYTYYTATAGTNPSSGEASYDICPKNWRLPTKVEYDTLYSKGKSSWTTNGGMNGYWVGAINSTGGAFFPAAGNTESGSLSHTGSYGHYWSSTAGSTSNAYDLNFRNNYFNTYNSAKYAGHSVRCVAR